MQGDGYLRMDMQELAGLGPRLHRAAPLMCKRVHGLVGRGWVGRRVGRGAWIEREWVEFGWMVMEFNLVIVY